MRTKVNIIFRTCDKVNALHGTDRPYGMTKEQIVNYCFISLKRSLAYSQNINDINHDVIVVGDELSQERIEWYKVYGPKVIYNDYYTNGPSIAKTFEIANDLPDDEWIYFCEDDYLHMDESFLHIYDFLDNYEMYLKDFKDKDLFIHPVDYPDRYSREDDLYKKWHIFISKFTHWRQIYNTTYTFLCSVKSFKKYYEVFMESAETWDDGLFSDKVFWRDDVICLSPMPSLACHMHEICMSPFIDWSGVLQHIQNEDKFERQKNLERMKIQYDD